MTDSSTLKEFLSYGYDNYKSDLYDLILWDHGGGPVFGYGSDQNDESETPMTINQLTTAINGSTLGKATNDNGFGMFRDFLKYKMQEKGKQLIKIGRWFPSSKTCHICGCVNKNLKLSDRVWTCECGETLNRDENAAINILREGLKLLTNN